MRPNVEQRSLASVNTTAALEEHSTSATVAAWQDLDKEVLLQRARHSLSEEPRPFLRWAGSKRHLLVSIVESLPYRFRTYWEPFLGGGSLFFLLRPERAVLSDSAGELIEAYVTISNDPDGVVKALSGLAPGKEAYYAIRASRPDSAAARAAKFIYLNQNCWNGLYRVNSKGEFNVPYGRPRANSKFDVANLRSCANALGSRGVRIESSDFAAALQGVGPGDLVFLDPPYVTRHNNNGFVDYNETLFSWTRQEDLAKMALNLTDEGANVVVTNADHEEIRQLYPGFTAIVIPRESTLAGDTGSRGPTTELVLSSIRGRGLNG